MFCHGEKQKCDNLCNAFLTTFFFSIHALWVFDINGFVRIFFQQHYEIPMSISWIIEKNVGTLKLGLIGNK